MGRYTTVQTYTDQDAKVAPVSYTSETTGQLPVPGNAAAASEQGAEKNERDADGKFKFQRVENVSGSSAGAGSGDFHMYRAARRRYVIGFFSFIVLQNS